MESFMSSIVNCEIKDISLAEIGAKRSEWAENEMPVLRQIKSKFEKNKVLDGVNLVACLHVTSETSNLVKTLKAAGANVSLCASNPLSTQDDIAAHLVTEGIATFAINGIDTEGYYRHIRSAIGDKPQITMDDGADVVALLHSEKRDLLPSIWGGTEETTTGVIRLRALSKSGKLNYPIVAVNDSDTKHLFDNRYGTGQSTIDGILRATNLLIAGKKFVIIGYGWCGKGLAMRAKGMGANTIVCEVEPVKALEAVMDGHSVMDAVSASKIADVMVTVTGCAKVLTQQHFEVMKDNVIIGNSGHFSVEIEVEYLEKAAISKKQVRQYITQYQMKKGTKINLIGEGRLLNLATAEGHPASVMDMSFANQALAAEYIYTNYQNLEPSVIHLPAELDKQVASLKLKSIGVSIDTLTSEQYEYLNSWEAGT